MFLKHFLFREWNSTFFIINFFLIIAQNKIYGDGLVSFWPNFYFYYVCFPAKEKKPQLVAKRVSLLLALHLKDSESLIVSVSRLFFSLFYLFIYFFNLDTNLFYLTYFFQHAINHLNRYNCCLATVFCISCTFSWMWLNAHCGEALQNDNLTHFWSSSQNGKVGMSSAAFPLPPPYP